MVGLSQVKSLYPVGCSETFVKGFEMQAGQTIKVELTDREGTNFTRKGVFFEKIAPDTCEVLLEHDKQKCWVDSNLVRAFMPLQFDENGECPFINEMIERDIPKIVQSLTNALAVLLPNQPFLVEGNKSIVAYNGFLVMESTIVESKTLTAFIEHPGWSVTVRREFPATRNEPESEDTKEVGKFVHYGQAVQKFIETLFLLQSEDYWDNQADLALVEQWERNHGENGWD